MSLDAFSCPHFRPGPRPLAIYEGRSGGSDIVVSARRGHFPGMLGIVVILAILALCEPAGAQGEYMESWINFSGYAWYLRNTEEAAGPMGNRFAGEGRSVILNSDKSLTLTLSRKEGLYYGAEAVLWRPLGYGTYIFRVRTRLDALDPNLVLGLFSYSSLEKAAYDEVDIEFSAWGGLDDPVRGQYAVQPFGQAGHISFFDLGFREGKISYSFDWEKDRIDFMSWKGYGSRPAGDSPSVLSSWSFSIPGTMPDPRRARICMNLYLAGKPGPAGSGLSSVIIDSFQFLRRK